MFALLVATMSHAMLVATIVLTGAKRPELRTPDSSGEMGFELQFNVMQRVCPTNVSDASALATYIAATLDVVAHASEQDRRSSTVLERHPYFDSTMEDDVQTGVGGCQLSRIWTLPSKLTCSIFEVVAPPLPLRHAAKAADAVHAYFTNAEAARPATVQGSQESMTLLTFHQRDQNSSSKRHARQYVLSTVPNPRCGRAFRTYCTPHAGSLLNATVFPQSTVAVSLHKLRHFFAAAADPSRVRNTSSAFARSRARKSLKAPQPSDFSQFLARVDRVCQAEALPEVYCGMLALSGHLLRSVQAGPHDPSTYFHAKYAMVYTELPSRLPIITRTNFASTWAYVREQLEHEERLSLSSSTLAATFTRHMDAVLRGDLPLGLQTTLFDWPLRTYAGGTANHFMRIVQRLSPALHAKGFDAAVNWLTHTASQRERMDFSITYAQVSSNDTVRLTRADGAPFRVADWIQALTEEGRDALSDHGSSFSVPVFKSMGAWAVGAGGHVHLELTRATFEKQWTPQVGMTQGWESLEAALGAYRAQAQDVLEILHGKS